MQAALDATTLMIATLKKHSKVSGDTRIAIIPFRTVVNIGTEYADAPWISYDGIITKASWGGCVTDRDQPNDVKASAPGASATTEGEPFPQGKTPRPDIDKVIILLIDGLNTANRFTTNAAQIEAMTELFKRPSRRPA